MAVTFLRSDTRRHIRLGKKKGKLQKWRKPKGRHNKIRRKRFGYPSMPSIGHRGNNSDSGKIKGLNPILVHNMNELMKADKNFIVILARVGAKRKLELISKASEMKIKIFNLSGGKK